MSGEHLADREHPTNLKPWHILWRYSHPAKHWSMHFTRAEVSAPESETRLLVALGGLHLSRPTPLDLYDMRLFELIEACLTAQDERGALQTMGTTTILRGHEIAEASRGLRHLLEYADQQYGEVTQRLTVLTDELSEAIEGWVAASPHKSPLFVSFYNRVNRPIPVIAEPDIEPEIESAPEPELRVETEAVIMIETEPEPEVIVEAEPEIMVESELELIIEPDTEPESEPEPEAQPILASEPLKNIGGAAIAAARDNEAERRSRVATDFSRMLVTRGSSYLAPEVARLRENPANPENIAAFWDWIREVFEENVEPDDRLYGAWKKILELAPSARLATDIDEALVEEGLVSNIPEAKSVRLSLLKWLRNQTDVPKMSGLSAETSAVASYAELAAHLVDTSQMVVLRPQERQAVITHLVSLKPHGVRPELLTRGLGFIRELRAQYMHDLAHRKGKEARAAAIQSPANRVLNDLLGDPSASRAPKPLVTIMSEMPAANRALVEPAMRAFFIQLVQYGVRRSPLGRQSESE
jgi:hypothetical protein